MLKNTILQYMKERLEREFPILESEEGAQAIESIIDHVDETIYRFLNEIKAKEERAEQRATSIDSAVDSSSVSRISSNTTLDSLLVNASR